MSVGSYDACDRVQEPNSRTLIQHHAGGTTMPLVGSNVFHKVLDQATGIRTSQDQTTKQETDRVCNGCRLSRLSSAIHI